MNRTLIIFAREPAPGQVKTRLAMSIGNQAATELYAAMLQDVQHMATGLERVQPMIFWAASNNLIQTWQETPQFVSYLQSGNGLGERMANAFATVFAESNGACCIIGSDAPDLPADIIMHAFETLESDMADVVFGPTTDGGYYLVGMHRLRNGLFDGIPWSSRYTLDKNLQRAAELGLRTALLPTWHDIDILEDVKFFCHNTHNTTLATYCAAKRLLPEIISSSGVTPQ